MSPARLLAGLSVLATAGCATLADPRPLAPRVDYHQHLVSPAFAAIAKVPPLDGAELLRRMDAAGVRQAVVLSTGYSMADERKKLDDPDGRTRTENDWTSGQAAASRGRLVGFCGVNPLRDAALGEVVRCLALPAMRGVKLHFGNSGVSLRNPVHRDRMRALFALLGRGGTPVLVHLRARGGENFGAEDARIFIDSLLPLVPRSDVVVAHFGGAGPGYPDQADAVMAVFADAVARGDRRVARTRFDLATILTRDSTPADAALIARRIRQVGAHRILYGSDTLTPAAPTIAEAWHLVTTRLGLSDGELRTIANIRLGFLA